jgi:hypothetical protein
MFAFFVMTFEPYKILICPAPRNDGLYLGFVKNWQERVEKRLFISFKFWESPSTFYMYLFI